MDKKSEFLGKESIRKLLFKLSAPIVVGMLVQALYNAVDTFFVGMVYGAESVQAIAGVRNICRDRGEQIDRVEIVACVAAV